jgi:two-component system, chemotaxis family, CheB/CheR fusion protein
MNLTSFTHQSKKVFMSFHHSRKSIETTPSEDFSNLEDDNKPTNEVNNQGINEISLDNKKLSKINQDQETFIYTLAHDLKAPLNNIEGLLALVKDAEDLEEVKSLMDTVLISVQQLKATVNDLGDIQSIGRDMTDKVDISTVYEEVRTSIADLLHSAKTELQLDFRIKDISFSRKNLKSIMLNLMSNAIKYKSQNRNLSLKISTTQMDDFVRISVQDNGIGIAKEDQKDLFKKFSRLHLAKKEIEGTGLGLYLVNRMVAKGGGFIKVESTVDEGTTFHIYLKN